MSTELRDLLFGSHDQLPYMKGMTVLEFNNQSHHPVSLLTYHSVGITEHSNTNQRAVLQPVETVQEISEGEHHAIRLLPARPEQFEALAQLFAALHQYNASFDDKFALSSHWLECLREHFLQTVATDKALWLLAWLQTDPVGFLALEEHTDSALFQHPQWVELTALYVVPSCRKTGLAYRLMEEARAWTSARSSDRLQLYVTRQNEHARAFYQRTGWRCVQEIWRLDVDPLSERGEPGVLFE